ncbi:uncharacterized protein LOC109831020 [Asparagus officinalis]|uniref:uncharacterized protein LOC109831020 n=1 Tax=Asparagus officinalis TaxID=4686 RepID=UPI00098E8032|nr:uncharacterized protein LOC109831020 [Asparagus officinalis]
MTLGIPAVSEDGGNAGPGAGPDTTTVLRTESLHSNGASSPLPSGMGNPPAGADIPSPANVSEPVGPQPEGTSVGIGSRSSLHERVRSLLADTDPDREAFRTDLSFFTAWSSCSQSPDALNFNMRRLYLGWDCLTAEKMAAEIVPGLGLFKSREDGGGDCTWVGIV